MKHRIALLAILVAKLAGVYSVPAQGTAFMYQGRLDDGAQPAMAATISHWVFDANH